MRSCRLGAPGSSRSRTVRLDIYVGDVDGVDVGDTVGDMVVVGDVGDTVPQAIDAAVSTASRTASISIDF